MKTQLLVVFLALAVVGAQAIDTHPHLAMFERLAKTDKAFRTFVDEVPNLPNEPGVSQACQQAALGFFQVLQDCAGFLGLSLGDDSDPTGGEIPGGSGNPNGTSVISASSDDGGLGIPIFNQTVLQQFCSGTCVDRFKSGIRAVALACSVDLANTEGLEGALELMGSYLRIYCLRDSNGNFCLPTVMQTIAVIRGDDSDDSGQRGPPPLNNSQLDTICTPCLGILAKAYAELGNATAVLGGDDSGSAIGGGGSGSGSGDDDGPNPFEMFGVMCLKEGTRYCYPRFVNFSIIMEQREMANISGPPPVEYLCDRCIQRSAARFIGSDDDVGELVALAKDTCVTDTQGRLCPVVTANTFPAVQQNCDELVETQTCTAQCKAAITAFVDGGGCCAGNALNQLARQLGITFSAAATLVKTSCTLTFDFPTPCPERTAIFRAALRNLKYSFYLANKALVDDKVKRDVASNAGVDVSAVTITGFSALSNAGKKYSLMSLSLQDSGTSITTSIASGLNPDAIVAELNAAVASGTFSFSSVASLPAAASFDPTAGAGDAPSPQFAPPTSAAAAVQPSLILAILLFALILL